MKKQSNFPRMHVSFYVKDIEKTVDFYSRFFGKEADKVKSDYAKFILEQPALIISFVQNSEKVNPRFGHLGIQVESLQDLEQKLATVKEKGLTIKEEMGTNCCYANQDKFWVSDPDGVQWEVYYFHKDVEFNDPRYSDASQSETNCGVPPSNEKQKIKLVEVHQKVEANACTPGSGCC
ncbi:ArsI/CadI family heavy metal resistance metalloenzyme [Xanthovirga aplysinae]|uniref:ArsI/CadI family heavy metal resistance metalloenzyme n=1 Tax=Xanthovirga aplysinae TaxID=2529853 RepID=UPI001656945B|nr:ArsI/CadI family heavy metal resistance metalloenzyme [Xanthovirga aplysinae]